MWTDTGATIGSSNFTTGDLKPTWKTTADSGWIMCDDGTIGDVSSGATNLASATTADLFTLMWTNFANTEAAVSTGRGVSAAADFAAHKTIGLPKMLGRVYGIAGAGAGLTLRAMGKTVGEETHVLATSELPVITPAGTIALTNGGVGSIGVASSTTSTATTAGGSVPVYPSGSYSASTATFTGTSFGSGVAHNVVQPTVFLKMMVKL